jgi:RNA polymerase sigma-70 factor (ECF subfamily)
VIAAVLDGDIEAYAMLVERHRDVCTRFAVRMLGSRVDADEALQSAFLRAFRALASCRDRDRFGAWLYRIVVNECRTAATRRTRRERRFVRDDALLHDVSVPHPADEQALREEIQRALDELDVGQREAFLLKHVEGLEYEEMAALTGVGVSALKMRVKRACARLRERLEGVHHA